MSNHVHGLCEPVWVKVTWSSVQELGIGYNGIWSVVFLCTGPNNTIQAILEMFPVFSRVRIERRGAVLLYFVLMRVRYYENTSEELVLFNCGWGTGGFKATRVQVHVFCRRRWPKGEMHPLAKPFSMFRFHNGALRGLNTGAAGVAH